MPVNSVKAYQVANATKAQERLRSMCGPAIDLSKDTGIVTDHGVTIIWRLNFGVLTISITGKPFYVPYSAIFAALAEIFTGV